MPSEKQSLISEDKIKPLAEGAVTAFAPDLITVRGNKVGYMCRDEPDCKIN